MKRIRARIVWRVVWALLAAFVVAPEGARSAEDARQLFEAANHQELVVGDFEAAIGLYRRTFEAAGSDRALAARALLRIGRAYETLGRQEAASAYRRLIEEFGDQAEAAAARERLAALAGPAATGGDKTLQSRRIWEDAMDDEGMISPDGRYLSFIDWGTGDVAIRELATGEDRRVTNKGSWTESDAFGEFPVFSRDGRWIAYLWYPDGRCCELRRIAVDGSTERILIRDPEVSFTEAGGSSPDGGLLSAVVETKEGSHRLVVVSTADGSTRTLKTFRDRHVHPGAFSDDGRFVLYDTNPDANGSQRDIYLAAVDGTGDWPLVEHDANDRALGWTPDGRGVLFSSDRRGTIDVWMIGVEDGRATGVPTLLAAGVGLHHGMGVTTAGALAYAMQRGTRNALRLAYDAASGRYVGEPKPASEWYAGSNGLPIWSSDGSKLAYVSWRDRSSGPWGAPVLVVRDLVSGAVRETRLTMTVEPVQRPAWSPDESTLVLRGSLLGQKGLYRVAVADGKAELLHASDDQAIDSPTFSVDGRTLFFWQDLANVSHIVAHDLESGGERVVVQVEGREKINAFALSPDGKTIAFRHQREDHPIRDLVRAVSVDGGEVRDLLDETVEKDWNIHGRAGMAWTPDGQGIVFGRWRNWASQTGEIDLWMLDVAKGTTSPLGVTVVNLKGLALNRSNRDLVFTGGFQANDVWLLEHFLPEGAGR